MGRREIVRSTISVKHHTAAGVYVMDEEESKDCREREEHLEPSRDEWN